MENNEINVLMNLLEKNDTNNLESNQHQSDTIAIKDEETTVKSSIPDNENTNAPLACKSFIASTSKIDQNVKNEVKLDSMIQDLRKKPSNNLNINANKNKNY